MNEVQSRVKHFESRQPGEPVIWRDWKWWKNGAKREFDPYGLLADPPPDEFEKLSNIVCYYRAGLERAVGAFDDLQSTLACAVPNCGNEGAAIDELKRLQKEVAKWSKDLEKAEAARDATETGKRIAERQQRQVEEQQRIASFQAKVRELRI